MYFAEGTDPGRREVLRGVAAAYGLDPDEMDAALDAGASDGALRETSALARALGIDGTPTFVFDGLLAASGAQPPEVIVSAVEAVLERRGGEGIAAGSS